MKIKVLFMVSTLERSGPVNVMYNIIKYLDRSKIEPVILTLSQEPLNSRRSDFEALSVDVFTLKVSRYGWFFSGRILNDVVSGITPNVIHSHSLRADVSSAKYLGKYKRVSTLHGDLYANYSDTYNRLIAIVFERRQISSIAVMDRAIACAESVSDIYRNDLTRLTSIQNGIDTENFFPAPNKAELRKALSLPAEHALFVTVGSLTKRKDPETIINGFLDRKSRVPATLLVIGEGVLEMELREKYGSQRSISFIGFVPNVNDYLMASDFFLSASMSEGLPNTVLEALGCGLPVGLSDIPSHREILDIDPEAGLIFSCGSPGEVSHAVDELLRRNYAMSKQSALKIIQNKLNARNMAQQYQSIYLELNTGVK